MCKIIPTVEKSKSYCGTLSNMTQYNRPEPLNITEGNIMDNLKIFRQEVEIYFLASETTEKSMAVQVAWLLNLLGKDALRLYYTFEKLQNATGDGIWK